VRRGKLAGGLTLGGKVARWANGGEVQRWQEELVGEASLGADGTICVAKREQRRKGKVEGSFYWAEQGRKGSLDGRQRCFKAPAVLRGGASGALHFRSKWGGEEEQQP
jgi:hypothetical protein